MPVVQEKPVLQPDDVRMSFGEHLEELRRRVIRALLGVALASIVTFYFGQEIISWLLQPLASVQQSAGLSPQVFTHTVGGGFGIYVKTSFVAGLILASPWVLYQLWLFVSAGLYQKERKVVLVLAPFSAVLSFLGVLFLYYLMLPVCLAFLIYFSTSYPAPQSGSPWFGMVTKVMVWASNADPEAHKKPSDGPPALAPTTAPAGPAPVVIVPRLQQDPERPVDGQVWLKDPEGQLRIYLNDHVRTVPLSAATLVSPLIEIDKYIDFVTYLGLGVVITFQMPLVMYILAWVGLVDPAWVARYRRICIFGCFALGSVLTPSDPISMFVLALPLWGLFELGLLLMKRVYRPRGAADPGA